MSSDALTPDHLVDQLIDIDPSETAEWRESLEAALKHAGPGRARFLMLSLLQKAGENNLGLPALRATEIGRAHV